MRFFWGKGGEQSQANKIDYSNLSDDELLDTFRSEKWGNLDENHRVAVFQEMENRSAAEQGRNPAQVVSMNEPGYHGGYTDVNNQIKIDVTNDSSYESLDTYLHESNHAYQSYCIQIGEGNYDEHTLSMMQAEMARDERGSLYNYRTGGIDYAVQCNELDSNNRAAAFMLAQENRFGNDPEYQAYMQNRENGYYSAVSTYLEQHGSQRTAMQQDQAYTAYVRGDISESQFNAINENLNSGQFIDSPAEECIRLNESISELNRAYQNEQDETTAQDYLGNIGMGTTEDADVAMAQDYMGSIGMNGTTGAEGQGADMSNGME